MVPLLLLPPPPPPPLLLLPLFLLPTRVLLVHLSSKVISYSLNCYRIFGETIDVAVGNCLVRHMPNFTTVPQF